MTADTALRLARHFGTTPEFWMNLQTAHGPARPPQRPLGQTVRNDLLRSWQ